MNHCMPTAVRLFAYGSLAVPLRQSDGIRGSHSPLYPNLCYLLCKDNYNTFIMQV